MPIEITELLDYVVEKNASDLHLGVNRVPFVRVDGDLLPTDYPVVDEEQMDRYCKFLLTPKREYMLEEKNEIDVSYQYGKTGRFRVNIFRQQGTLAAALRLVPDDILAFEDLNLPIIMEELSLERRGIIVITGTTGSGKSTTLASIIEYINNRRPVHIITIEDPIEFVHYDKEAIINQRELGVDTNTFLDALRGSMREDPDIIMVGEMRDRETVTATFQAALTGHLVFTTLHTLDVVQTINRIIDYYPSDMQKQSRLMLSETIKAVVSMRLLPMVGGGRVPAMEIMKTTGRIREFIEQRDKTDMIKNAIEEGNAEGMITFDQYLLSMFRRGLVTYDTAIHAASSPHDFRLLEQQDTDFADRIMTRMEQFQHVPGQTKMGDGL